MKQNKKEKPKYDYMPAVITTLTLLAALMGVFILRYIIH
jgi:hypothetical protein